MHSEGSCNFFAKKCQPFYLEHIRFLIERAGWKVTIRISCLNKKDLKEILY